MTQLNMHTLLQSSLAPEVRLPDRHAEASHRTFYVVIGCVMAIGLAPLVIGWTAATILK